MSNCRADEDIMTDYSLSPPAQSKKGRL
jgi:hypothetical protein